MILGTYMYLDITEWSLQKFQPCVKLLIFFFGTSFSKVKCLGPMGQLCDTVKLVLNQALNKMEYCIDQSSNQVLMQDIFVK